MTDIPTWAKQRACDLANEARGHNLWNLQEAANEPSVLATFARYIAATETAPIDPLLLEAREIVAQVNEDTDTEPYWIADVRDGKSDACDEMLVALASIKRGIELGREQST